MISRDFNYSSFYLFALIMMVQSCSSPKNETFIKFFESLTYKNSEWREDDFGTPVKEKDKTLLEEHKPKFWISKRSCGPMDFYKQFLPLLKIKGSKSEEEITRAHLKRNERQLKISYIIDDAPKCISSQNPPLYSYAWLEEMEINNGKTIPIKVLKYAFSFYKSGLPEKQTFLQSFSSLLGRQDHWHYLDIHGAIFYLLNPKNKLIAVVLAQHNHFRSFVIGVDLSEEEAKKNLFFKSF